MKNYQIQNANSNSRNFFNLFFDKFLFILSNFTLTVFILIYLVIYSTSPAYGAKWVEIDEGVDSGDTYLWPYFYTASRFVDIESINKKDGYIIYKELVNSRKAISSNVLSLIVEKKSFCDGKKVLWQHFSIYKLGMGKGKPIMKLNPNESQDIKRGSAGFITDAFVCNF